jgi:hypothetical protein
VLFEAQLTHRRWRKVHEQISNTYSQNATQFKDHRERGSLQAALHVTYVVRGEPSAKIGHRRRQRRLRHLTLQTPFTQSIAENFSLRPNHACIITLLFDNVRQTKVGGVP